MKSLKPRTVTRRLARLNPFAPKRYRKKAVPKQTGLSPALISAAQASAADVLASQKTTSAGLPEHEAEDRLKEYGPNTIAHQEQSTWYSLLLSNMVSPFNILLLTIALVSYFTTQDLNSSVVIVIIVCLSVTMGFVQEYRSSKATEALQDLVETTASVCRIDDEGHPLTPTPNEVPLEELVPGDIIQLSSGDMIPADVRVISSRDLLVAEAALTGEAIPVEKEPEPITEIKGLDLRNICFMGTNVVSGTARAVVINTGKNTYFGALAKTITRKEEPSSFDKGISQLSWMLIRFILVMVTIVLIINGINKGNWLEAFLFALSVAVGLTPEMLPMIITTNLAKGAMAMSKNKVIVKRLNSIQNFGAMDILCTDKTGTLTQNRIILDKHLDVEGNDSDKVLKYAYLNSFYQTGLKNLLDEAVLKHAEVNDALKLDGTYHKVDEIPFDFNRRRMSVLIEDPTGAHFLIAKGAVEEIFQVCSNYELHGSTFPVDEKFVENFKRVSEDLNEDGFRVIALAYKSTPNTQEKYTTEDEKGLTLLGYISFLDPPKETALQAIAALNNQGVSVKILTGDNDLITRKVCKDVGIVVDHVLLGPDIDTMATEQLIEAIETTTVFAKLTPRHKERIICLLRQKGHVVGFLGDGINDAAAMKAADVGISVDNAADIAKESADIILLEKNLMVLEKGVTEGRIVFGNTIKYIRMALSSNFGNVFSIVGASIILPFLPMLPIHILVQNLLYNTSQIAIPLDRVDEEYLAKPRKWEIQNISRFMFWFGPISSIFDYALFAVMWFIFGANSPEKQTLFQSGWFIEGLLSQTLIIHMIRTRKIPFIQSSAAWPLSLLTVIVMIAGVVIPFSPIASSIHMVPLPLAYFPWLALILVSYCLLTQSIKVWYSNKFGYN